LKAVQNLKNPQQSTTNLQQIEQAEFEFQSLLHTFIELRSACKLWSFCPSVAFSQKRHFRSSIWSINMQFI